MITNINDLDRDTKIELLSFLSPYLTDNRKQLFEEVLQYRTRHITVVLEDIYQPQNASAVLRSADLTGIQDVHIIENQNEYQVNPKVAMGSSKWLNLIKYNTAENNTLEAFKALRKQDYRIIATTPHTDDQTPYNLPLGGKWPLFLVPNYWAFLTWPSPNQMNISKFLCTGLPKAIIFRFRPQYYCSPLQSA